MLHSILSPHTRHASAAFTRRRHGGNADPVSNPKVLLEKGADSKRVEQYDVYPTGRATCQASDFISTYLNRRKDLEAMMGYECFTPLKAIRWPFWFQASLEETLHKAGIVYLLVGAWIRVM